MIIRLKLIVHFAKYIRIPKSFLICSQNRIWKSVNTFFSSSFHVTDNNIIKQMFWVRVKSVGKLLFPY